MRDSICNDCAKRTRCDMAEIGRSPLARSTCYGYEKGNPTNADRIRAMTDEELAKELLDYFAAFYDVEWTVDMLLDWLKQEVSDDNHVH